MAGPALAFAAASSTLDIMGGLFGYLAGESQAKMAESRARLIRMESEAEAQRYSEQAASLNAQARVNYVKSGVKLSGSPLDVLDHDMLIAKENVSAIRAQGRAAALDYEQAARQAKISGRLGLFKSIFGAGGNFLKAGAQTPGGLGGGAPGGAPAGAGTGYGNASMGGGRGVYVGA